MIRKAEITDLNTVANLAILLWEEHTIKDLVAEFTEIIETGDAQFFLAYAEEEPIGFAQCQLRRDYVEGTETSPVGYLEGIFVKEGYRRKGYAKRLLSACESWAKEKGCVDFGSDCQLDNIDSLRFHLGAGFTEAARIICFSKKL